MSSPPFPTTHARIGWKNELKGGSSTVPAAAVALVANTFERWTASTGTVDYQALANFTGDYVAIGAHTLGSTGKTVTIGISSATTGAFTTVYTGVPANDNAIMVLFASQSVRRVQIAISGGSGNFSLGVVYSGTALQMQRPVYGGVSPLNLSQSTEYNSTVSDSGNWLSRSVVRKGLRASTTWEHLQAAWVRTYLKPFIKGAVTDPFFIAWRPGTFPNECAFAWATGDIVPQNMGIADLMSVTIDMEGYGGVE